MCGSCGGNKQANGLTAVNSKKAVTFNGAPLDGKVNRCTCTPKANQHPCDELTSQQRTYVDRVPCVGDYEQHLFETPDEDICDKGPREPYHIPGYAGHVPTVQLRNGHTFGQDTHEVLTSRLGQSSASYGKGYHVCPEPMHEPYRIPGYTGYVPGLKYLVGGTYGSDTHKLLYSVDSYPNRQENLSPYKLEYGSQTYGNGNNRSSGVEDEPLSLEQTAHPHQQTSGAKLPQGDITSSTYQRPKDHYLKPQFRYRIGDTYATRANLTLVDPCVNKETKVTVSTRELDDTQVVRTQDCLEERVESLPYVIKPVRHRPVVPGFDTFIDALQGARGQRFEFTAISPSHKQLQQQLVLQRGKVMDHSQNASSGPGLDGTPVHTPQPVDDCDNLPYGYAKYGGHQRYTNSALYDFTSNYRSRMSPEWAPAGISRPDPPAFDVPGEIYNQHVGLLPGYSAHVPGATFRCGKTFTDDSRDARRALRGDRL